MYACIVYSVAYFIISSLNESGILFWVFHLVVVAKKQCFIFADMVNLFRGMRVTSGKVEIAKDEGNLIGISIGGGAPLCPCLYVVQVYRRSLTIFN